MFGWLKKLLGKLKHRPELPLAEWLPELKMRHEETVPKWVARVKFFEDRYLCPGEYRFTPAKRRFFCCLLILSAVAAWFCTRSCLDTYKYSFFYYDHCAAYLFGALFGALFFVIAVFALIIEYASWRLLRSAGAVDVASVEKTLETIFILLFKEARKEDSQLSLNVFSLRAGYDRLPGFKGLLTQYFCVADLKSTTSDRAEKMVVLRRTIAEELNNLCALALKAEPDPEILLPHLLRGVDLVLGCEGKGKIDFRIRLFVAVQMQHPFIGN
jgi:hypothetical protein